MVLIGLLIIAFTSFLVGPNKTFTGLDKNIYISNLTFGVQGMGAAIV